MAVTIVTRKWNNGAGAPRITATLHGSMRGQRTIGYDFVLGADGSHREAARVLAAAFNLRVGELIHAAPPTRTWAVIP